MSSRVQLNVAGIDEREPLLNAAFIYQAFNFVVNRHDRPPLGDVQQEFAGQRLQPMLLLRFHRPGAAFALFVEFNQRLGAVGFVDDH